MAQFILKDSKGKEQTFDHETIYVRDTNGELVQFTQGTGTSTDIRYVTFMSHDGSVEYGKKAVAVGDDCADPIARGIFAKPTRESDAQYNYTFYGWATEPNGGADANWNKAITEDKTVYANYSKTVRYYTITFYDEDGSTVLTTKSVAYGSVPSYTPTKSEYDFTGWDPTPVAVAGDASYKATWTVKASFATATWSQIADVCASGNHASAFTIGDSRPVKLTYADGTSETINFTIVDMNADVKAADGSAAALTLMAENIVKTSLQPASAYNKGKVDFYDMDNVKTFLATIFDALPSDLQGVITPVYKRMDLFRENYISLQSVFIASEKNLFNSEQGSSKTGTSHNSYIVPQQQYAAFANGATKKRAKVSDATQDSYWTSSLHRSTSASYLTAYYTTIDGGAVYGGEENAASKSHGIVPCFCIG